MSFAPRRIALHHAGTRATVDVGADGTMQVTFDGGDESSPPATVTANYLGHGRLHLHDADGRVTAYAVDEGTTRWVFLDGETFVLEIDTGMATRGRGPGDAGLLAAPMPATVVKVAVAPGLRVARGDMLVLLEAMKMELPLRAPHDAVVVAVRCAEGELVDAGVALVELDAAIPSTEVEP